MTTEQIKDISSRLFKLRESRGTSIEKQRKNFRVDFTNKLVKYYEAERDDDEFKKISSLCDMLIVSIDAGVIKHEKTLLVYNNYLSFGLEYAFNTIFSNFDILEYDPYHCLLEKIKEIESRAGYWDEKNEKLVEDVGAYTKNEAMRIAEEYTKKNYINSEPPVFDTENSDYWYFLCEWKDGEYVSKLQIKKWYKPDYKNPK